MSYSIVVVTWECADYLAELVESMNEHLKDDPQFIVVDNASSDDPNRAAQRWRGETNFVQLQENLGFGRASNIGVRVAKHEAVVLLNPDVRLVDGSLSALAREALVAHALVGPRVLNPDGSVQPSASGSPVGFWPWINTFVPGVLMPAWMKARTEPWRLEARTRVAWLTGCCIAAPRALLDQLGPFDATLELYSEDLELGLRAGQRGVASVFAPDLCQVVHYKDGSSARRFLDHGGALAALNRRIVLARLFGRPAERAASRSEVAKLQLRIFAKALLGRPTSVDAAALRASRAAAAHGRPEYRTPGNDE